MKSLHQLTPGKSSVFTNVLYNVVAFVRLIIKSTAMENIPQRTKFKTSVKKEDRTIKTITDSGKNN